MGKIHSYLIVVSEMTIGYSYGSRSHNSINETILTIGHGHMVNPNIGGAEDGNAVAVAHSPQTHMVDSVSDHSSVTNYNVMDTKTMDDDISYVLKSNASAISNLNIGPSCINGLVASHDELLGEPNGHVGREGDPQRSLLDYSMTKSPRFRVHEVRIRRVVHYIVWTQLSTNGLAAKTQNTIG